MLFIDFNHKPQLATLVFYISLYLSISLSLFFFFFCLSVCVCVFGSEKQQLHSNQLLAVLNGFDVDATENEILYDIFPDLGDNARK